MAHPGRIHFLNVPGRSAKIKVIGHEYFRNIHLGLTAECTWGNSVTTHAGTLHKLHTCTGGLSEVCASILAKTLRNASHAEQSAPPEGTMIELLPLGLQENQHLMRPSP